MHVFLTYFAIPYGAVWSNLIAWAVITLPAIAVHHTLLKRHMTRITSRQSAEIRKLTDDQTQALRSPREAP